MFDRPILLYSEYCIHSTNFINTLMKHQELYEDFIRISIDVDTNTRQRPKIFYDIQNELNTKIIEVPTVMTPGPEYVLAGSDAFDWLEFRMNKLKETSKDIEGWLVANEGSITVALDVTISEELRKEGIARELINRIQNARKDSGLDVTDRIKLTVLKFEDLEESINNNKEYIMSETLTDELVFVDQLIDGSEIEFDTIKSKILIHKM